MRDFARQHKHHLALWIILLLITAISGYFAFISKPLSSPNNGTTRLQKRQVEQWDSNTSTQGHKDTRTQTDKKVYTIVDFLTQPKQQDEPSIIIVTNSLNVATNTLSATLELDNQKYTLVYTNGDSLYTAMDKLQTNTDFRFGARNFGGSLGYFVEEINGVKNDRTKGKYWVYSINGEKAKIGVSNYILKSNDIILWDYEKEITEL